MEIKITDLVNELMEVCNMRVKLDHICQGVEELAKLGIIKPEELRGLTTVETIKGALEMMPQEQRLKYDFFDHPREVPSNMRVVEDKQGFRWGLIHAPHLQDMLLAEVLKARTYLHKNQVALKDTIHLKGLQTLFDNLKGAVMIAYPGYYGLPDYEPVKQILENLYEYDHRVNDNFDYFKNSDDLQIWWAGKEFQKGKQLKDHVGKNEKTKIIIRI